MTSQLKPIIRNTPVKYFAIHLREYRTVKGWDQDTLAHMAGISTRTIQRIEAGQSCSLDTLKSVSAAMDLKHFSELLPQPKKNEYRPKPINLLGIVFSELVIKNALRAFTLSLCVIGFLSFMNTTEMASDRYADVSVEDRIATALEQHRSIKPDHPLFIKKTEEEVIASVHEKLAWEKEPLSKSDWNKLYGYMITICLFFVCIASLFSVYRVITTYEFDELIGKPLADKLSCITGKKT